MSLEIRHLVVNATVESSSAAAPLESPRSPDPERLRDEIMQACREMVRQLIRQQQER